MRYFVLYLLIFFSLTACGDDALLGVLPTISSVTNEKGKAEGPISGKTAVTIRGTHFADDAVVTFGGLKATAVVVKNETTLVATTDSVILSGLVSVGLTTGGQIVVKPEAFVYTPLIAFSSNRFGPFEIFTMEIDGNIRNAPSPIRLTNTGTGVINESPVFSPDGKHLLFSTNRATDFDLFLMDQDGRNPVNLTNTPGIDQEASFSPDGKKIVFASKRLNGAKNPESDFEIFLMDRDGTNSKQLTTNSADDRNPSFSPDGKRILFSSDRDGVRKLFLMNTDGAGVPLKLTKDSTFDDDNPIFSPDGKQVVFVSNRTVGNEIYVIDIDGGNPLQLTTGKSNAATPAFLEVPTHSIELLFSADHPTGNNREIFVMSCSGDQTRAITNCDEAGVTNLSLNSNSETTPSPSP